MTHASGAVPEVTVITGAYNAMPYLTRSAESVLGQTIGRDRIQYVLVDDGSTDGTGAELDRLAAEHGSLVTVIHQENSGGPGGPRNVGLEHARGRYVFFLDADDYLGPEALERMVRAAEENGSDVVLGKMVGQGGRKPPRSMFRTNQPRTDVFSSRVYWTLSPMKLFRRELIEKHELRFRPELKVGQDQPFVAAAYLNAAAISVIADYDCVNWVNRDDGGNNTTSRGTEKRLTFMQVMFELVGENVPPGPRRDHLLHRHFSIEVPRALTHLRQEADRGEQEKAFTWLRELVTTWYTPGIAALQGSFNRMLVDVILHGTLDDVLEAGRLRNSGRGKVGKASARWAPGDPGTLLFEFQCGLPGEAGGPPRVELVDESGNAVTFAAEPLPAAGAHMHVARVPLTRLAAEPTAASSAWTLSLGVHFGGHPGRVVLPVKSKLAPVRWRQRGRQWRAVPLPGEAIRLQLEKGSLLGGVRSAVRDRARASR